jgi:hypothetical protein
MEPAKRVPGPTVAWVRTGIEIVQLYAGDTATVMNGEERAFLSAATVSD